MNLQLSLDLFPMAAAILASLSTALLGNFLLLRRQSLLGDAISHSVLPGLVFAYAWTGSRDALPMLVGAALAGTATVLFVSALRHFGRIESSAAMGVVFTLFFALGIYAIESAELRQVDLDADCVLYGQLETLVWYEAPQGIAGLSPSTLLDAVPRAVRTLFFSYGLGLLVVLSLFKEWRLSAFDPAFATAIGFRARGLHILQIILIATTTVAAFEAVGSILVIAMLVTPPATARLWTDRFSRQLWLSQLFALLGALFGYVSATAIAAALGLPSFNAAGMIAVVLGLLFSASALFAPRHGLIARRARRRLVVH